MEQSASGPPNKEMKLTKPGEAGASQLISGVRQTRGGRSTMTERGGESSGSALRAVVNDLQGQQRRNGWLLTIGLVGLVAFFRWLNEGPYAGNSIYFVLVLVVITMRAADHQLAQGVPRLAKLLADADRPHA
jgi:hypothetical protein